MAIIRMPKEKNYTIMSNYHLTDPELSFKAKGLLSYMLSRPNNWDFTVEGLARLNKEGADTIGRIIRELEAHGYIVRRRIRGKDGKYTDMEYDVLEIPRDQKNTVVIYSQKGTDKHKATEPVAEKQVREKPLPENPVVVNPSMEQPVPENRGQLITDIPRTVNPKTEREKTDTISHPYPIPMNLEALTAQIKGQIEYDCLIERHSPDEVDNMVALMTEVLSGQFDTMKLSGRKLSADMVRKRFKELTFHHIEYVFECLQKTRSYIRNIKQYLLTVLFNAPAPCGSYYRAAVRYDLGY